MGPLGESLWTDEVLNVVGQELGASSRLDLLAFFLCLEAIPDEVSDS